MFLPLSEFLKCLSILEICTRSCNAPSPNLSRGLKLSVDSNFVFSSDLSATIIVCSSLN